MDILKGHILVLQGVVDRFVLARLEDLPPAALGEILTNPEELAILSASRAEEQISLMRASNPLVACTSIVQRQVRWWFEMRWPACIAPLKAAVISPWALCIFCWEGSASQCCVL